MGDIGDFIQFPIGKKDQFDRKLRRCMIISLLYEIQKDPHRLDKRLISFGRIAGRKISAVITLENAALPFQMGKQGFRCFRLARVKAKKLLLAETRIHSHCPQ